jgi:hypothetical protein
MKTYIVKATIPSCDWDKPDYVLEETILADSWEEAVAIATKMCCIPDKDFESFINGDGDYSHSIDPDWTPWSRLTWEIVNSDWEGTLPSSVVLEECSPRSAEIPLVKACQAQNEIIQEKYNKAKKLEEFEKLKKEFGL